MDTRIRSSDGASDDDSQDLDDPGGTRGLTGISETRCPNCGSISYELIAGERAERRCRDCGTIYRTGDGR